MKGNINVDFPHTRELIPVIFRSDAYTSLGPLEPKGYNVLMYLARPSVHGNPHMSWANTTAITAMRRFVWPGLR